MIVSFCEGDEQATANTANVHPKNTEWNQDATHGVDGERQTQTNRADDEHHEIKETHLIDWHWCGMEVQPCN